MATIEQAEAAVQPRRRIGTGAIALLIGLICLLLFLAVFAVGSFVSARQLQAELDKIREAGEPVTVADMEAFYARPPKDRDATQLWLDAFAVIDSPGYRSDAKSLPIVGENEVAPLPGEPWPQLDAAEEFLAKYREPLEKMHQASAMRGEARYPLRFSDGIGLLLPHAQLSGAVQLLKLESEVRAHRGDSRAAAESVRAIFAAARTFERQPIAVSQLFQTAMNELACEQIERFLPAVEFSQDDLIQFDRELAAIDEPTAFRRALLGERAIYIQIFANPPSLGPDVPRAWGALRNADETTYLILMAKLVAASQSTTLPLRDAIHQTGSEITSYLKTPNAKWRYPITRNLFPDYSSIVDLVCRADARQAATRTAIAIERYRRKTGATPKTLDELVPEFLDQPPVDPFDQAPLRYQSDATGYKIYSIGPDGVDQGGDASAAGRLVDIVFDVRAKASVDAADSSPNTPAATEQPPNAGE